MFITIELYFAFVQLRKQLYKLKTQKQLDKYSKIENYRKEYKTFDRFYNRVNDINNSMSFYDNPVEFSTQEYFDYCLDNTKNLKKLII